jgi:iron complex outermembrane recepter protein
VRRGICAALLAALAATPAHGQQQSIDLLVDLSLEDLANVTITSVSRSEERLSDAAASIYVITAEDIRRSGVTSLPEALRLAPNLQVARIDASQYAISARGFNNAIGNKLLVLIDGRTIYTPLFSGVFWDQQDVMLEDVERIEVISGPGGTLWGANAVNGVINVITRPARDTQGQLLALGAGNLEHAAAFRHGGELGEIGHFRVYAKGSQLQNTKQANGAAIPDGRDWGQGGFRADWKVGDDAFTVQGDAYNGRSDDRGVFFIPLERLKVAGMNLLGRWTRSLAGGSSFRLQAYLDRTERKDALLYRPQADVMDVEFQHGIPHGAHKLLWGGGYRRSRDDIEPGVFFGFVPASRELEWANVFAQEQLRLSEHLDLTFGLKLESNDYSGIEYLPSARLAWKATGRSLVWLALSRAVRAPARLDHDIRFPPNGAIIRGGHDFDSEVANVLEVGYRAQPSARLTYSATAYFHQWDRLRSGEPAPAFVQNEIEGNTYGVEAWGTWQVARHWRLSAGATTFRNHLRLEEGSNDPTGPSALGNDPEFQWMLRSSVDLPGNQEFDAIVRRVGRLPNPSVREYTAVDLRYGWRVRRDTEISLTIQNAFDPGHAEFNAAPGRSEIARSAFLRARWAY